MKRHIEYFKYVIQHKWFVFLACLKLRVPLWTAIIHDWSKFTPSEWSGYANNFFKEDGTRRKRNEFKTGFVTEQETREFIEMQFLKAWHHHESTNKHHWGYWLTLSSETERYVIQSHGTGYPLFLYDLVEKSRFNKEINDDGSFLVGGTNSAHDLLVEIRDRLNRDSRVVALEMPEVYVREMIADWVGAGRAIAGQKDPRDWYDKNKHSIVLHPRTSELVEKLLNETIF